MDDDHRRMICDNLVTLVRMTNYPALLVHIERNDKTSIIPESFLRKWKTRLQLSEWTLPKIIHQFYEEIQKRGPNAFSLLVRALSDSGPQHQELARLLDPSISEEQSPCAPPCEEVYNEDGENCLFIDDAWQSPYCLADRTAITSMFQDLGFIVRKKLPDTEEDIASCVVINFHSFRSDGCVRRDEEWIHKHFLENVFHNKPKILLSFQYKSEKNRVEHDSAFGRFRTVPYSDILWVRIYVKSDAENTVSPMVKEFINICTLNPTSGIHRLMNKLNQRLNELEDFDPIEVEKWGFKKDFFLKKTL